MAALALLAILLSAGTAQADTPETTWIGTTTTGTLWATGTDWNNGLPTTAGGLSGTSAVFNTTTTYTAQPYITAAGASAAGIWVTGASGGVTTTISGVGTLSLSGSATLDGIANVGILLDGAGNNNLTISTATVNGPNAPMSFYVNNGGTLDITSNMNLGQFALTVGATTASGSGTIILAGKIAGNGGANIVLNDTNGGSTSLILSGDDTFAGGISALSGSISFTGTTSGNPNYAGPNYVGSTGANGILNESSNALISGSLMGVQVTGGLTVLNANNDYYFNTIVSGGTLTLNGTQNYLNSTNGVVTSGNGDFNETAANLISGTGATFTVNSGTTTLIYANNYGGVTKNGGGTLIVTNTGALGTNTTFAAVTLAGGTTRFLSDGTSNNGTIAYGGGYGYNGSGYNVDVTANSTIAVGQSTSATGNTVQFGTLDMGAFTLTATNSNGYSLAFTGTNFASANATFTNDLVSGTLSLATLTGTANAAQTMSFNGVGSNAVTVVGAISQTSGTTSVTQSGAGDILVLNGSNSYLGLTTVNAGQLVVTNTSGLGADAAYDQLAMTAGTTRLLNDGTGNNGVIAYGNSSLPADYSIYASAAAPGVTINVDHYTSSNTGNTIQLGNLFNASTGVIVFTNGDGYNLTFSGSTLAMGSGGSTFTNNMVSGTLTLATLTGTATAADTATFNGTSASAVTVLGTISQTSGTTFNITQSGSGTLLLTASDSALGSVSANGGTVRLSGSAGLSNVTNMDSAIGGVFDLNGISQTVNQIQNNGTITNTNATEATLTGNLNGGYSGLFTGNLNINLTDINAGSALTETGPFTNVGNIVLTNTTALTLTLSGTLNNTGTITDSAASNSLITISGPIGANVTNVIESGTASNLVLSALATSNIAPGQTVTLTTNSVTGANKQLNVSGTIGGSGNLVLDNNSAINGGINLTGGTNLIVSTGTITNAGTGSGWTVLSGNGDLASFNGTLVQNSASSALAIAGLQGAQLNNNALVLNGQLLLGYGGFSIGVTTASTTTTGTTILLGAAGSTNNVSVMSNGTPSSAGAAINNNITVTPGFLGTATIGMFQGQAITYSGTFTYTGVNNLTLAGYGANAMTLKGPILGGTNLTISGSSPLVYSAGTPWGINYGNVVLTGSNINTFSGQTTVLAGNLVLGGTSIVGQPDDEYLGTSSTTSVPILVGATSGAAQAGLVVGNAAPDILNRSVVVQAGNGGDTGIGGGQGSTYYSPITLYKSAMIGYDSHNGLTYSGTLSKAATAIGAVSLIMGQDANGVATLAKANSYDGGTVDAHGTLITSASGALGSGNVVIEAGLLQMSASNQLAPNAVVYVGPYGLFDPSSATLVTNGYLQKVIDPNSSGAIGFTTNLTGTINMATIGDGDMYFALVGSSLTYSGTSLGADADGNYRLGWDNTVTFSISNSVLVGSGTLIVGGAIGNGNPYTGVGSSVSTMGAVNLTSSNTYSGGTVVNPYSTLNATAQTVAGASPFGSSTAAITLHDASLGLTNNGTAVTTTTVGAFSFDGNSTITVTGTTGDSNTLALGSITRVNTGTLVITPPAGGLGTAGLVTSSGGASLPTFSVDTNGNDTANVNMVAPYITDGAGGDFLTYGANGFTPISTLVNNLGVGLSDSYVKTSGSTGFSTLSGPQTIAALSMAGTIVGSNALVNNGSNINLLITTGGLTTAGASAAIILGANIGLTSTNEFFIDTGANGLFISGSITATNGITKNGAGTLELSNTSDVINGTITVNQGILSVNTVSGAGGNLIGTVPWGLPGQTTFGQLYSDAALGSANIYLDGGDLSWGNGFGNNSTLNNSILLSSSRTIFIGPDGGTIAENGDWTGNGITVTQEIVLNSLLSGTGDYLDLGGYGTSAQVGANNVFLLTNTGNNFSAPVNVFGATLLVVNDGRELGGANAPTNTLTFWDGNSGLQFGNAGTSGTTYAVPTTSGTISNPIAFIDGGGEVDVLSTASGPSATVLTLSGKVTGDGSVYKNGLGTLALTATGNTFEGSWVVSAGVLSIDDPTQLGLTTAVVSGTNLGAADVSGNAAYIEPNGELAIAGSIALGGTGGKTLYVSGTGAGDGGAIANLSGSNSDAGQTVLQANTTVYAAASSSYTFGGAISDGSNGIGTLGYGLTVAGPGAVITTASNTYTGATTVAGGATFQVGNGGATGALAPAGTIVDNGSLVFNRSNNVTQGTDFSSTSISGTGSLTWTGPATLKLNVANSFSGATNVLSGTLNAAATGAVGSTTAINVSSGGTFLASAANVASAAASVTLNGGTLKGGPGFSQGTGATVTNGVTAGSSTQGFGNLTLTANSTLDFNDQSTIVFGAFNNNGNTLNVVNYVNNDFNTTTNTSGIDGTDDRLIFDNGTALTAGQLADINFGNVGLHYQISLGNGFYEVSAVPEPTTIFAGLLLIGLLGARERRRLSALYRQVARKSTSRA